jgi:hypothetical protein
MEGQKCQVMVWEMDRTYVEGHDSSWTIEDSRPCNGWSFCANTERALVG